MRMYHFARKLHVFLFFLFSTEHLCMLMFNVMGCLAYYLLLYTVYDLNSSNLITLGCLNKICLNRDSLKQLN